MMTRAEVRILSGKSCKIIPHAASGGGWPLGYGPVGIPLTLTLSPRRGNRRAYHYDNPDCARFAIRLMTILPLPEGEGRGEGKGSD